MSGRGANFRLGIRGLCVNLSIVDGGLHFFSNFSNPLRFLFDPARLSWDFSITFLMLNKLKVIIYMI